MFAYLNNDDPNAVKNFLAFLNNHKAAGRPNILIITSRFMPVIFKYLQEGGEEKMGPFPTFCQVVEAIAKWEGTTMPVMQSGVMHEFDW